MYDFINTDPEGIREELTGIYSTVAGVPAPATGSDADLLIAFLAFVLSAERQEKNRAISKNFIEYAEGEDLDRIGYQETGRTRGEASKATTTLTFSVSAATAADIAIPAGTRATADRVLFFATTEDSAIPAGETEVSVPAECTLAGSMANGISAGAITIITDTLPEVEAVTNSTATHGGADIETDEEYRESLWASYGALSDSGSEAGYLYYAKEASAAVQEASVDTDGAGTVNICITPASEALADEVQDYFDNLDERGFTDKVVVSAAETVKIHAQVTYTVAREDRAREAQIDADVLEAAQSYLSWQCGHLNRGVNADRLKQYMYNAGADTVSIYRMWAQPADDASPAVIVNGDNRTEKYADYSEAQKNVTVGIIDDSSGVTVTKG
jgi:uncharacterized phage protein gp47/JayE